MFDRGQHLACSRLIFVFNNPPGQNVPSLLCNQDFPCLSLGLFALLLSTCTFQKVLAVFSAWLSVGRDMVLPLPFPSTLRHSVLQLPVLHQHPPCSMEPTLWHAAPDGSWEGQTEGKDHTPRCVGSYYKSSPGCCWATSPAHDLGPQILSCGVLKWFMYLFVL